MYVYILLDAIYIYIYIDTFLQLFIIIQLFIYLLYMEVNNNYLQLFIYFHI